MVCVRYNFSNKKLGKIIEIYLENLARRVEKRNLSHIYSYCYKSRFADQ